MKKPVNITLKNVLKVLLALYGICSVIFCIYKADKLISSDDLHGDGHIILNDSWTVTINGVVYEDVSINDLTFESLNKYDEITLERLLPENWNIIEGALRLYVNQTAFKLYIDDEIVYEYGYDRLHENKTVGSGYQFIDFPSDYEGKTMKIRFNLGENHAFSKIGPIHIYEWENAYRILMTENRYPMFLGCFLLIFGIVISLITLCAMVFSVKYIRMLCISIFSICIGLWTLCYYDVLSVFSIPLYSISLLEYSSLYLSPLPLLIYIWGDVKNLNNKVLTALYKLLFVVQFAATIVMLFLHSLDILHCAATLKYMQILIVIGLIYFLVIDFMNLRISNGIDRLFIIGMLVVVLCIFYDLVRYYLERYLGLFVLTIRGATSIGVIIFTFILIGSFYINLTRNLMKEAERASLIKRAYTDELTQMHNRRYCMEYIDGMKEQQDADYTIVCFDLNNLKTTNDTYGHAKGDILIKSAASVISDTFEGSGAVARMGGDEFIAILHTSDSGEIDKLMEQFQKNISNKNQEIEGLNMSIACGYASCNDKDCDINKVYQLADDLMYENKKKMKSEEQAHVL